MSISADKLVDGGYEHGRWFCPSHRQASMRSCPCRRRNPNARLCYAQRVRREVMEEDITPYKLDQSVWNAISPVGLSPEAVETVVGALVEALEPLVIVGYTGRNHATVSLLVELTESIPGLRVLDGLGSDVCF